MDKQIVNKYFSIVLISLIASCVNCKVSISQDEGLQKCMTRSGLTRNEIDAFRGRNEGCTMDCSTRHGTIMTFFVDDNTPCHTAKGYRCLLGKCQGPDVERADTKELYNTEIRIVKAHVPDCDTMPTKGESDTYVVVKVMEGGQPTYNDGELVCHTYTILDDADPMWQNFVCKPLPLKNTAMLSFGVYDSDKPMETPDLLGVAMESVEFLMNRGPTKLRLSRTACHNDDDDYHIVVDIRGDQY